ncbi:MAG TPA: HAMP domain-containing sensor histidine kinase, partial [Steroidobacteraceae bacterium]|nr:HAMP domain-containing sensor histidine kinase [Steroidobacteraceae bacterium]
TTVYLNRQVETALNGMAAVFDRLGPAELARQVDYAVAYDARRVNMIGVFDAAGRPVAGNLRFVPSGIPQDGAWHRFTYLPALRAAPGGAGQAWPAAVGASTGTAIARVSRLTDGGTFVLGRDVSQMLEVRNVILDALIGGGAAILALGLAGSFALATRPLRRIRAIRSVAQRIMLGELQLRIPQTGRHDELELLSATVNRMLDEIARLLIEVKSATDTIAHDLRTPLTRLRASLYRALQDEGLTDRPRALLEQALADTEALLARFRALLRIAEIEARERRAGFVRVDLGELVRKLGELFEPLAEEKSVAFAVDAGAVGTIEADPDLLFEALSNLLDNAIKFTPRGGAVRVVLAVGSGGPRIDIHDSGPGIAASEREAVLRRFYRASRTRGAGGYGLGLSIVAAVMALHGFKLEFQDCEDGAHVTVDCWPHPFAK